jgi:5-methylcytosine-specific restriction endonuclease McrA
VNLELALKTLVEPFEFRWPGPEAIDAMYSEKHRRAFNLSNLKWGNGACAWCCERPTPTKRKKYCDTDCQESAFYYCAPQTPASKAWRFMVLQHGTCRGCGEIFEKELLERVARKHQHNKNCNQSLAKHGDKLIDERVSFFQVGYNTGDKWQIDHIKPIFMGGQGIGIDNIQVLCVPCHSRKTASERRVGL